MSWTAHIESQQDEVDEVKQLRELFSSPPRSMVTALPLSRLSRFKMADENMRVADHGRMILEEGRRRRAEDEAERAEKQRARKNRAKATRDNARANQQARREANQKLGLAIRMVRAEWDVQRREVAQAVADRARSLAGTTPGAKYTIHGRPSPPSSPKSGSRNRAYARPRPSSPVPFSGASSDSVGPPSSIPRAILLDREPANGSPPSLVPMAKSTALPTGQGWNASPHRPIPYALHGLKPVTNEPWARDVVTGVRPIDLRAPSPTR